MASGDIIRIGGTTFIREITAGEDVALKDALFLDKTDKVYKCKNSDFSNLYALGTATSFEVCTLDTNKLLIMYSTAATNLSVVVATVDPTTGVLTFGTPYTLTSATSYGQMSICVLSTTKAIIVYYNGATTAHMGARVLTIADTAISAGAEYTIPNGTGPTSVTKVDTDKAVVAYGYTGNTAVRVLSVSGTTITGGTEVIVDAILHSNLRIKQVDTNVAVLTYMQATTFYLVAVHIGVSGTTVTAQTPVVLDAVSHSGGVFSFQVLSTTRAAIYAGLTAAPWDSLQLINISGTTITAGTQANILLGAKTTHGGRAIMKLSATQLRLAATCNVPANDGASGNYLVLVNAVYDITGDAITQVGKKNLVSMTATAVTAGAHAQMVPCNPTTPDIGVWITPSDSALRSAIIPNSTHPEGLCVGAALATFNAKVLISGLGAGLSGLTPGAMYGIDADGKLSTVIADIDAFNNHTLGFAVSATEILWLPLIERLPYIAGY